MSSKVLYYDIIGCKMMICSGIIMCKILSYYDTIMRRILYYYDIIMCRILSYYDIIMCSRSACYCIIMCRIFSCYDTLICRYYLLSPDKPSAGRAPWWEHLPGIWSCMSGRWEVPLWCWTTHSWPLLQHQPSRVGAALSLHPFVSRQNKTSSAAVLLLLIHTKHVQINQVHGEHLLLSILKISWPIQFSNTVLENIWGSYLS